MFYPQGSRHLTTRNSIRLIKGKSSQELRENGRENLQARTRSHSQLFFGSLVLFLRRASLLAPVQKEMASLCNFSGMAAERIRRTQRPTVSGTRYMCLAVVARRLKNVMTCCLQISTAGQIRTQLPVLKTLPFTLTTDQDLLNKVT